MPKLSGRVFIDQQNMARLFRSRFHSLERAGVAGPVADRPWGDIPRDGPFLVTANRVTVTAFSSSTVARVIFYWTFREAVMRVVLQWIVHELFFSHNPSFFQKARGVSKKRLPGFVDGGPACRQSKLSMVTSACNLIFICILVLCLDRLRNFLEDVWIRLQ